MSSIKERKNVALNYFQDLLRVADPPGSSFNCFLTLLFYSKKLKIKNKMRPSTDVEMLEAPVTWKEIWSTFLSINGKKALGQDGYIANF